MKVPFEGKMVDATEVEVLTSKEDWNEYQLANGDVLSVKSILIRVSKINDIKGPDGNAIYNIQNHFVMKVKTSDVK